MKKALNERKALWILLGLALFGACLLYLPFIVKQIPYEYGTIDTREENFAFYSEMMVLLDQWKATGTFPFYSWSSFLGSDFFIGRLWYITTDFTMILCAFFKVFFWDALMLTTIFKVIFAAFSMYILLSCYRYSPRTKIIGALCYAFCAELTYYAVYPIFLLAFCFIPLYLAGMEAYLKKGKKLPFIFASAALLVTNFYYFFAVSFFSPIYFSYRYYIINNGQWKGWFKSAFKLVGYYCIGVMLTGIVLLPLMLYMSGNSRVGVYDMQLLFKDIRVYLTQLCSAFLPLQAYQTIARPFSNNEYSINEIFFWAGSIIAMLVPQFLTDKNKIFKSATILFYTIFILIVIVPAFSAAMHGFSTVSFRGMILLVISNILIACRYLNNMESINRKNLIITGCIIMVICLMIVPLSAWITGTQSELLTAYMKSLYFSWGSALMFFVFMVVLLQFSKRKFFYSVLLFLTLADLWIFSLAGTSELRSGGYRHSYQFMKDGTHVLQTEINGLNDYLNDLEPVNYAQYFRVYIPQESLYWSLGMNSSNFYQLNGLSTYDSTFSPSLGRLEEIAPEIIRGSNWYLDIRSSELINYLNVKYAVVSEEAELPEGVNWRLMVNNYLGWLSVYRNDDYRELGTMYSEAVTYDEFMKNPDLTRLQKEVVCNLSDLKVIQNYMMNTENPAVLENISYQENWLRGTVNSEMMGFMVLTLPYEKGWKVMLNGAEVPTYAVNGGFIGIPVAAGVNQLEMYYIPAGLKTGVLLSAVGVVCVLLICLYDKKKRNKNP